MIISAWSPWLTQDIEVLEKVQRRAVNMIVGLNSRTYEDKVNLTSLSDRRKKFDLLQACEILNGFDRVSSDIWLKTVGEHNNRLIRITSYSKNLDSVRSRTDIRKNFFSNRVVNLWNNLPIDIQDSRTVKIFKNRLEQFKL